MCRRESDRETRQDNAEFTFVINPRKTLSKRRQQQQQVELPSFSSSTTLFFLSGLRGGTNWEKVDGSVGPGPLEMSGGYDR